MPLTPGTRLGPYEIVSAIGAGGMGEVYRARDTRLNRDVAIKILPEAFAADADRVARFQREAQVLASLNHPHIASIYGVEEGALILELVDGLTLADRIAQGPIPLDEALPMALQIAEALEAAHEHGIIHRDLKPANIKLTSDGTVKVLDFGLAKATEPAAGSGLPSPKASAARQDPAYLSQSPTITSPAMATHAGVILGTAAYMSPEQAKGKPVDKRSDIWAFGCVLFEMLTGQRPFGGEDVTDSIAFVITKEPDWTALPPNVSPALASHLRRCLAKDRRNRIHDIADMRLALEGAFETSSGPLPAVSKSGRRTWAAIAAGAFILLGAGVVGGWLFGARGTIEQRPVRRFMFGTSPGVFFIANTNRDLVLTPDGSRAVYFAMDGGTRRLFVRPLDSLAATAIRDAPLWYEPFVSPDGKWIGFNDESDYTLRKVSIGGGPPMPIAPVGRQMLGASWGPDDSIIFATLEAGGGLWRVPANGGTPVALTKPDQARGETFHAWPEILPDGRAVLFTVVSGDTYQISVLNLDSGEQKIILPAGTSPRFLRPGYLVYGVENALRAVRFDPVALKVIGEPVPVLQDVLSKRNGGVDFSVGADGTLAYVADSAALNQRGLVWVDRKGHVQPIAVPSQIYGNVRLAPDGTRIVLDVRDRQQGLWVWDITRETLTAVVRSEPHLASKPDLDA